MNNKFLAVIIIAILAVIVLAVAFSMGLGSNNEAIDSSNWEVKELGGIKFKVPDKYKAGTTLSGNIIDGVATGDSYQKEDLVISINDTNWDSEFNKSMTANSGDLLVLDINGTEITTFSDDGNSIAFFKVDGNKIAIKWKGNDVNGDIKAIIASFYELN